MEEQRDAFVVVIEYEGMALDRKATATIQRAISDAAHRVMQHWKLGHHLGPEIEVKVKPLTADEHE